MYLPIWLSGETVPATGYRDIFNGCDIELARPDRLPTGPDGKTTLYVPLRRQHSGSRNFSIEEQTWQKNR